MLSTTWITCGWRSCPRGRPRLRRGTSWRRSCSPACAWTWRRCRPACGTRCVSGDGRRGSRVWGPASSMCVCVCVCGGVGGVAEEKPASLSACPLPVSGRYPSDWRLSAHTPLPKRPLLVAHRLAAAGLTALGRAPIAARRAPPRCSADPPARRAVAAAAAVGAAAGASASGHVGHVQPGVFPAQVAPGPVEAQAGAGCAAALAAGPCSKGHAHVWSQAARATLSPRPFRVRAPSPLSCTTAFFPSPGLQAAPRSCTQSPHPPAHPPVDSGQRRRWQAPTRTRWGVPRRLRYGAAGSPRPLGEVQASLLLRSVAGLCSPPPTKRQAQGICSCSRSRQWELPARRVRPASAGRQVLAPAQGAGSCSPRLVNVMLQAGGRPLNRQDGHLQQPTS